MLRSNKDEKYLVGLHAIVELVLVVRVFVCVCEGVVHVKEREHYAFNNFSYHEGEKPKRASEPDGPFKMCFVV